MGAFVNHQVVRFGEPPLAVLTHKLALGPHLSPELVARHVVIYLHYGEHLDRVLFLSYPRRESLILSLEKDSPGFPTYTQILLMRYGLWCYCAKTAPKWRPSMIQPKKYARFSLNICLTPMIHLVWSD